MSFVLLLVNVIARNTYTEVTKHCKICCVITLFSLLYMCFMYAQSWNCLAIILFIVYLVHMHSYGSPSPKAPPYMRS